MKKFWKSRIEIKNSIFNASKILFLRLIWATCKWSAIAPNVTELFRMLTLWFEIRIGSKNQNLQIKEKNLTIKPILFKIWKNFLCSENHWLNHSRHKSFLYWFQSESSTKLILRKVDHSIDRHFNDLSQKFVLINFFERVFANFLCRIKDFYWINYTILCTN